MNTDPKLADEHAYEFIELKTGLKVENVFVRHLRKCKGPNYKV